MGSIVNIVLSFQAGSCPVPDDMSRREDDLDTKEAEHI
jgi:hypothetical protein